MLGTVLSTRDTIGTRKKQMPPSPRGAYSVVNEANVKQMRCFSRSNMGGQAARGQWGWTTGLTREEQGSKEG